MIPRSIRLKGFLCYKDEQTIDFGGGSTLWMLSGLNGSGKSAIFDALTFSLFGHHRGGATSNHELINKDCEGFLIEFDFLLDERLYRIKRTLRRKTGGGSGSNSQQILRHEDGKWTPIDGTHLRREFDSWIRDKIGLDYDTFTSSVLLLQGNAEKLLSARPEGRREVLARIVDLERFEMLHQRADERRKNLVRDLENLGNRLAATPVVEPIELAAADEQINQAQERRDAVRLEVERLQTLEFRTKSWQELQGRLQTAHDRLRQANELLGDAAAIEKAAARLRELRDVLPQIQVIVEQRAAAHTAEERSRELGNQRQKRKNELDEHDNLLKQVRDKKGSLQLLIARDEARHTEMAIRLRASTARMATLKEYESHEADLQRVRSELSQLPARPAEEVAKARSALLALEARDRVVPLLDRFVAHRTQLKEAQAREQTAKETQQTVEARGKSRAAETEALRPQLSQAAAALQRAVELAAEERTRLQQAQESLRELTQLDGAKVCRHCGQKLTATHVKEQKKTRAAAVEEAEARMKEAATAQQNALAAEQKLREDFTRSEKAVQDARIEFRDAAHQFKQAKADVERLQAECGRDYADLPEELRCRVSPATAVDWATTSFPTGDDLKAIRSEAAGLPAARARCQQAEQVEQNWNRLKTQKVASVQNLARLRADLPADPQTVRTDHARLESDERALEKGLQANRAAARDAENELERLTKDREQVVAHLGRIDAEMKNQQLTQQHARQTVERTQKGLPAAWQAPAAKAGMREWNEWDTERAELLSRGTDDKARQLEQARLSLDVLRQERDRLEAQQESFTAEERQDPAAVQALSAEARQRDKACEDELLKVKQQKALLESHRRQREQIEEEILACEQDHATQKILSDLLGRDRLQLFLVRQAERQVVEHANAVLDRLSGGQLALRLIGEAERDGGMEKALSLEAYNRVTGEKPINVAFLSGSQKFRVAVSLALGLGQCASKQHRPIEAVIIDEGFGCLDRQGLQVMIQELQNLRGQMRCILLVSHQEEFAEAFADGYRFTLEGGATRVTRFQK